MKKIFLNLLVLTIIVTTLSSCNKDEEIDLNSITQEQKDDLMFLREEEKLARDVYLFSYDIYGDDIFNNIATSEQKHMDKVLKLLTTYGIDDPAVDVRGVFTNQVLQDLYDDLTALAEGSLVEALTVGATIEDLDINDIDDFEASATQDDILSTYEKLSCGSRNHMRAYYSKLLENNITYSPQFISIESLNDIVNSGNEQCGQ